MEARQHHKLFSTLAVAVLGTLLAWGLWQCYGDWLITSVAAHVS